VKRETRSFYEDAVRRAIAGIEAGLDEALDLTALARAAALSPLHFHHVFRGMVGETPLELHRRLRLERAAMQLASTEAAVTTVAFAAGYETHESFTRAFRRAYAASPSEFRARTRPNPELPARSGIHIHRSDLLLQGDLTMNATIETLPEMTVAAVHHVGPYNQISEAFGKIGPIAGRAGLFDLPDVMMVGLYYDDPEAKPAAELQSDAGLVVPPGTKIPDGLTTVTITAGRYVKTTHKGPYDRLGDVWSQLLGVWIPQSGHRIGPGVSFEVYRNDPTNAKPEDLVTELYAPIA
jgi:AraC family transcriptional regulator